MVQVLLSEKMVAVYELLLILVLVFLLAHQIRKNKDIRERRKISNEKMRNVQLEEMLKNPDRKAEWSKRPNPFDVQYSGAEDAEMKRMSKFQAEIEVRTETSIQRYLFDLNQEVTIGRDDKNVLPLGDRLVARKACCIFVKNQAVCLKSWNPVNPICIRRGKRKHLIRNQTVKLQNKDILMLGKTELLISLYEN